MIWVGLFRQQDQLICANNYKFVTFSATEGGRGHIIKYIEKGLV